MKEVFPKKGDLLRLRFESEALSMWAGLWGSEAQFDSVLIGKIHHGDVVLVLEDGTFGPRGEIHVLHPSGVTGYVLSYTKDAQEKKKIPLWEVAT